MSNKKGLEPAFPIAYKNYGSFGETEDHECGVSKRYYTALEMFTHHHGITMKQAFEMADEFMEEEEK